MAEPEITDLMVWAGATVLAYVAKDGTTAYLDDAVIRRAYSVMRAIEMDPAIADRIEFGREWTDAEIAIMRSRIRLPSLADVEARIRARPPGKAPEATPKSPEERRPAFATSVTLAIATLLDRAAGRLRRAVASRQEEPAPVPERPALSQRASRALLQLDELSRRSLRDRILHTSTREEACRR